MTEEQSRKNTEALNRQQKNVAYLLKLMSERPFLPVIPMVDSEIVAEDGWGNWTANIGAAEIRKVCCANEKVVFLDEIDPWETMDELDMSYEDWGIDDEAPRDVVRIQCTRVLNTLEWMEAIIVDIVLPEYKLPDNTERARHGMAKAQ